MPQIGAHRAGITTQVAAAEVKINGQPLEQKALQNLIELKLEQYLMLPDAFTLRLADPKLELVDNKAYDIGKAVTIAFCSPQSRRLEPVFDGEITALEPEFTQEGTVLTIRGYDRSHRLNRVRKSDTFQQMTASDIAKKIASANGLAARVTATTPKPDFTQQSRETDWEFLWRLASMHDYEVVVEGKNLWFRPAGGEGAASVRLAWAESRPMLISLRPRVTGVQQVKDVQVRSWDPKQKKEIVAKASVNGVGTKVGGVDRAQLVSALGGGTLTVAEAPVLTITEANELANALSSMRGVGYVEADGVCEGDPRIAPGAKISIEGIGTRFAGDYMVSKATHVYKGGSGYFSNFVVAGRSARSLLDLMSGGKQSRWADSIVVGIVTNNQDPDGLGRVRVKYPTLDDQVEGWWARIVGVGSGKERGQLMTPLVGDEVLVAFESGDARKPYVLGTLWNGKDTPGPLVHEDGSYHLKSDKQIVMNAKEDVTITTDKKLTIEVKTDASEKIDKNHDVKVGQNESISVTQKFTLEAGTELELKCGQATIKMTKMGQIDINGAMVNLKGSGPVAIKGATVAIN